MPDVLELIANTEEAVYAVDSDQQIILWNKGAEEVLGYTADEALGRHCYDLLMGRDEDGRPKCMMNCAVMDVARSEGRVPSHYCAMKNKEGKPLWLHLTHVVIPSKDSGLEAVVHIVRDVTEYMEAKELVQRLLSYMARNPVQDHPQQEATAEPTQGTVSPLTKREREVMKLLAQGKSPSAIASDLVISAATARNHIQNILSKLNVHSALEAVVYASRNGLI